MRVVLGTRDHKNTWGLTVLSYCRLVSQNSSFIFTADNTTVETRLKPGLHYDLSISTSINISSVNRERHKHKHNHTKKGSFPFSCAHALYAYVAKISVQKGCNISISIIPRK